MKDIERMQGEKVADVRSSAITVKKQTTKSLPEKCRKESISSCISQLY